MKRLDSKLDVLLGKIEGCKREPLTCPFSLLRKQAAEAAAELKTIGGRKPIGDVVKASPNDTVQRRAFSDGSSLLLAEGALAESTCKLPELGGYTLRRACGFSGGWLLCESTHARGSKHLVAIATRAAANAAADAAAAPCKVEALLDLTPHGCAAVGELFARPGTLLVEIDGLSPGPPALYRAKLPDPPGHAVNSATGGSAATANAALALDTSLPLETPPGSTAVRWLVDAEGPLVARAVLVEHAQGFSVFTRDPIQARVGGAKWIATCERLQLPLPPVDENAPLIWSEWREVAHWARGSGTKVLGFRDELLWLHEKGEDMALNTKGELVSFSAEKGECALCK